MFHLPAFSHEVFDVTGAGDTVVAVLTLALVAGADLREAVGPGQRRRLHRGGEGRHLPGGAGGTAGQAQVHPEQALNRLQLLKTLAPGFLPLLVFIAADALWGTTVGLLVAVASGLVELARLLCPGKGLGPLRAAGHAADRGHGRRIAAAGQRYLLPPEAGRRRARLLPGPGRLGLFARERHPGHVAPLPQGGGPSAPSSRGP